MKHGIPEALNGRNVWHVAAKKGWNMSFWAFVIYAMWSLWKWWDVSLCKKFWSSFKCFSWNLLFQVMALVILCKVAQAIMLLTAKIWIWWRLGPVWTNILKIITTFIWLMIEMSPAAVVTEVTNMDTSACCSVEDTWRIVRC